MDNRNLIRLGILALWIFPIAQPGELAAQDSCVCLQHAATDQFYRNCSLHKGRNDFYPTALQCRGRDDDPAAEPRAPFSVDSVWRVIPEGEEGCENCQPLARNGDTVPRGDKEQKAPGQPESGEASQ